MPCCRPTQPPCGTTDGPRAASALLAEGHVAFRRVPALPTNEYPGCCALCGHRVPAGAGIVERNRRSGGWSVLH